MDSISFDNSYARLPERFHSQQPPAPVAEPSPIRVNRALATELGIDADWLAGDAGTQLVAGNTTVAGSEPIATVYAGHQFGGYNPQLGDGRAVLLGEVLTRMAADLICNSKGPDPPATRAVGMAARGSDPCCVSIFSVRPCIASAFPPRGRSRQHLLGSSSNGSAFYRVQYWLE